MGRSHAPASGREIHVQEMSIWTIKIFIFFFFLTPNFHLPNNEHRQDVQLVLFELQTLSEECLRFDYLYTYTLQQVMFFFFSSLPIERHIFE